VSRAATFSNKKPYPMRFSTLALQAFLLGVCTHNTSAQKASADTLAFIKMFIQQPDKRPASNQTLTLKSKKGHILTVKTDAQGIANATVPINNTFEVFCDTNKIQPITTDATPNTVYDYSSFAYKHCIFNITCQNQQGEILSDEVLTFENTKTGKKYTVVSDKMGKANITLPQADYKLHLKYVPNYKEYKSKPEYEFQTFSIRASWEGSAAFERQQAAEAAEIAEEKAYEAEKARLEKIQYLEYQRDVITKDLRVDFLKDTESFVTEIIWKKAEAYKKRLATNPQYLKEQDKHVILQLSNASQKIPNATILLALGDSYYRIFEHTLIWQAMNSKKAKFCLLDDVLNENFNTFKDTKSTIQAIIRAKQKRAVFQYDSARTILPKYLSRLTAKELGKDVIWVVDSYEKTPHNKTLAELVSLGTRFHIIVDGLVDDNISGCQRLEVGWLQLAYETKGSVFFAHNRCIDFSKINPAESFTVQGTWDAQLNKNGLIDYIQHPKRK
jgi:hypothetical protein